MTLEEKLRAYAAKGELVSLSLLYTGGEFRAAFTAASTLGGHAFGQAADPVEAIEKALKASPAKPARVSKPKETMTNGSELDRAFKDGSLNSEWTAP